MFMVVCLSTSGSDAVGHGQILSKHEITALMQR